MKYYSESLKQFYETEDECKEAETKALEVQKQAEAEKERLAQERKVRAEEVEDARKAMIEAQQNYEKVLGDFLRDYKTYHYSIGFNSLADLNSPFDWLFNFKF